MKIMQHEIVIEWKHIGKDVEKTCERCGETGLAVVRAVEEIRPVLEERGIAVRIIEAVLPDEAIAESNSILVNGIPLEDLVAGTTVTATPCTSCACITRQDDVECRAVEYGGALYEAIPAELIRRVILNLAAETGRPEEPCCPGCGCEPERER
jgi:hypothetical protein